MQCDSMISLHTGELRGLDYCNECWVLGSHFGSNILEIRHEVIGLVTLQVRLMGGGNPTNQICRVDVVIRSEVLDPINPNFYKMSIMNKETLSVSPCCSTVQCRTDQDTTITPIISHSDTLPPSLPCQDRQSGSVLHSLHQWLLPLQGNIVNENLKLRQNELC